MVKYESGNYHDKNWSETIGTYGGMVIPDEETALKIAKAIFDGMEKAKMQREYVPQSVFYDNQDEIWIVSFGKNSNHIMLGGDCNIAMQKKDGKVFADMVWRIIIFSRVAYKPPPSKHYSITQGGQML
ncbi:MAG: hypothetical protein ACLRR6_04995 [Oscillospiraceae bacterium]